MEREDAAMIRLWDGQVGQRWATDQARYERMTEGFAPELLAAARIQAGMRVLDVGCGTGARSLDAARVTGRRGRVIGVDVSSPMLAVARREAFARDLGHARFLRADVQSSDDLGHEEFDVVLSQFGVMFFTDPTAAFTNLVQALRPGGHLAFTCWQHVANQQHFMIPFGAALEHLPKSQLGVDAWPYAAYSMADPSETRELLSEAGFEDIEISPLVAPMYQGQDLNDALRFLAGSEFGVAVFNGADPASRSLGWEAIAAALRSHERPDGVFLDGAAWLVTATRP